LTKNIEGDRDGEKNLKRESAGPLIPRKKALVFLLFSFLIV
jgi:hypothetical protein